MQVGEKLEAHQTLEKKFMAIRLNFFRCEPVHKIRHTFKCLKIDKLYIAEEINLRESTISSVVKVASQSSTIHFIFH